MIILSLAVGITSRPGGYDVNTKHGILQSFLNLGAVTVLILMVVFNTSKLK